MTKPKQVIHRRHGAERTAPVRNSGRAPAPPPAPEDAPTSASVTGMRARGEAAVPAMNAEGRWALLNQLVGRGRLVQRLAGIQYNGNRDIYAAAGYVTQGREVFAHYWGLYRRGDVAGRIVDMPAQTTWRTPPEIVEEGEPDGTEFTEEFNALAKRLRLWAYFNRVDKLAGIGEYAVLFLGVRDVSDGQLWQPLEQVRGPEDLIYLSVYHQANAPILEWERDPGNERFGLPRAYELRISASQQGFQTAALKVHASRVLHIAENLLEDDIFGRPRLERSLNRLFDLDKVAASTGEAYWQLVSRILQAKIDPEMEIDGTALADLDTKMSEMVHDLRRQFFGQGVDLSWLGGETPNVQQVADFYFSLIAGATGIPKRILFGSELGQLASETDQASWFGQINERQEQFAEPDILRQFIDRCIALGALPMPKTGEYRVVWPALYEESSKDKAARNASTAAAAAALTPVGGNPRELVEIDAEGDIWLVEREPDGAPEDLLPPPEEDGDNPDLLGIELGVDPGEPNNALPPAATTQPAPREMRDSPGADPNPAGTGADPAGGAGAQA